MATLHSGYELETTSANTRRYSNYSENDTGEDLNKAAASSICFSPIADDTNYAEQAGSANTVSPSTPRQASIYESNIELAAITSHHDESNPADSDFSLPPVDVGKQAWLFLFSAFVLEILVWGTYFTPHFDNDALTLSRIPIFIWLISGVLHVSCTIFRVTQHRHYRYLRPGSDVPFFTDRHRLVCLVPKIAPPMHPHWSDYHVSCFGTELLKPDGHAFDRHTRCLVRNRRRLVL